MSNENYPEHIRILQKLFSASGSSLYLVSQQEPSIYSEGCRIKREKRRVGVIYQHTGSIIAQETGFIEGVGFLFGFRFLNRFKSCLLLD